MAAASLLWLAACASAPPMPDENVVARDLVIRRLAPNVWLHVTAMDERGTSPANGLIYETPAGAVLIDVGWTDSAAERLLEFCRTRLKKPVVHAILTHSHADRAGGLAALLAHQVPVTVLDQTAAKLGKAPPAVKTFSGESALTVGGRKLELFHPGHGHSPDNITVYLPREKLLFGGCFLKSVDARELGNLADAELSAWPEALRRLKARYPGATTLVPGHGEPGGKDLFLRTDVMLKANASAAP